MARTPVESPLARWRQEVYEAAPERTGETRSTISGIENEPLYTPDNVDVDYAARPRPSRRLSVHARRLSVDVPRPPLDDAAVRGLRLGGGDERALPLPPRARSDRPLHRLRHADADGLRLRPRPLARRGRPRGRRGRLDRRHAHALRRDPAGRRLDVDDDQLAGRDPARVLRLRRPSSRASRAPICAARRRRTSSRSTSRRRSTSTRRRRRCGS